MSRVLVTGGGSGIGRSIARDFAARGHDVTIAGRGMDGLRETAQGYEITCRTVDVTDEALVDALFDKPFDIVVANAGAGTAQRVADMPLSVWQNTLNVNLTGVFLTFRAALQGMEKGGRLIAVASTASLKGGANIAAYAAAKHGVLGLVRSLAIEVARGGITCNAVCPGFVDTDMGQAAVTGVMDRLDLPRDKAERMVVGGNPMRRMIDVDEVTAAVRFLASPEASMVNGHALSVSGGEI
jgi:NAD(P)-dependent dehydrogenase (short-subunit alcohol dehydrogenase family)